MSYKYEYEYINCEYECPNCVLEYNYEYYISLNYF